MAVQFLVLRRNGALSDSEWLKLTNLRHHLNDLKKKDSNDVGDFGLIAKAVQKYSGTKEDLSLVESLLGRVSLFTFFCSEIFANSSSVSRLNPKTRARI